MKPPGTLGARPGGGTLNATLGARNIGHRVLLRHRPERQAALKGDRRMEQSNTIPAPLRALLAEAAECRRDGDHGAAVVLDVAALLALRAYSAEARGGRHG